jgi:hypothetical protein
MVNFHPYALERLLERNITEEEVVATIVLGEQFPAKYGRTGFVKDFPYNDYWKNKFYKIKQIEVYAVYENDNWLVITVISKFY